jgi:hypothetical protein
VLVEATGEAGVELVEQPGQEVTVIKLGDVTSLGRRWVSCSMCCGNTV